MLLDVGLAIIIVSWVLRAILKSFYKDATEGVKGQELESKLSKLYIVGSHFEEEFDDMSFNFTALDALKLVDLLFKLAMWFGLFLAILSSVLETF